MVRRTCTSCNRTRSVNAYSSREWEKGPRAAKCLICSAKGYNTYQADWVILRDDGCEAEFSPAAFNAAMKGGHKFAIQGQYTSGLLKGYDTVAKWPKKHRAFGPDVYNNDIRCARHAVEFVQVFNALKIAPVPLRVIIPSVQVFDRTVPCPARLRDTFYLREPKVQKFQKWNLNSGLNVVNTPFARAMQAFTHFTYHESGGQCIVCDIQGALYHDQAILTDLAIVSHQPGAFGATDLGAKGLIKFFSKHVCNEFCNPEWGFPAERADGRGVIMIPNPNKFSIFWKKLLH